VRPANSRKNSKWHKSDNEEKVEAVGKWLDTPYTGPGNSLNLGKPTSVVDAGSRVHDNEPALRGGYPLLKRTWEKEYGNDEQWVKTAMKSLFHSNDNIKQKVAALIGIVAFKIKEKLPLPPNVVRERVRALANLPEGQRNYILWRLAREGGTRLLRNSFLNVNRTVNTMPKRTRSSSSKPGARYKRGGKAKGANKRSYSSRRKTVRNPRKRSKGYITKQGLSRQLALVTRPPRKVQFRAGATIAGYTNTFINKKIFYDAAQNHWEASSGVYNFESYIPFDRVGAYNVCGATYPTTPILGSAPTTAGLIIQFKDI